LFNKSLVVVEVEGINYFVKCYVNNGDLLPDLFICFLNFSLTVTGT